MRNLSLQGEVRHVLPRQCDERLSNIHIVAVVQNTSTYLHIGPGQNAFTSGDENHRLTNPPVSFVLTSDGNLMALDTVGRKVWIVDLEKVADDSNEDGRNENVDGYADVSDAHLRPRSQWFYAGSFVEENSPDAIGADKDGIMDMHLASECGFHITCLSHAGHVVSVSIDDTNTIASKGGNVEEGSECIGTFENGLESGGWSPDGEILALVTFASDEDEDGNKIGNANYPDAKIPILMTMNTQYETLAEIRLDPCLIPLHSSDIYGYPHSNSISICWRPDSSTVAVSTVDTDVNNKAIRRIRTYNRTTLQILSVSKEEDGSGRDVPNLLPVPPTWAPSGGSHYVGAVQSSRSISTKSAKSRQVAMQVAFMEPNGLRHRECKIHNTTASINDREDVIGVAFNLEGDLLVVTSIVTTSDSASHQQYHYGKVQFYHSSNFHWYLKYELRYNGDARTGPLVVTNMKFSEEDPYQIVIALKQQKDGALEWREYMFRWDASTIHYCDNYWLPTSSSVLAMTIDGKTLNFTALDKAIIPPPMYASSLELPAPAVGIATRPCFCNEVATENRCTDFIVALSDGRLALLKYGGGGNIVLSITPGFQPPSLLAVVDPFNINRSDDSDDSGLHFQGMVLRDISVIDAMNDSLTVVALSFSPGTSGTEHHFDILVEMKVSWIAQTDSPGVTITYSLPLEGRALRVVSWSDMVISPGARGKALVELTDGSLLEYSQGGILAPCGAGPMLEPCPWIAGIYDAHRASTTSSNASKDPSLVKDETSEHLVIGLSPRYRLYSGERLLSNASSSFVISLPHKFLTHVTIGSQPQLKFLPLATLCDFDPLQGSDDQNAMLDGYEPRSVERGTRLVAFFPTLPIVVLQMPRGNLESITPRACLLPYIMLKILRGDFLTALDVMRRQRVDLNLIVDINPYSFLEKGGAEQFVGQIEKIDNINLFLSSLIDVDTTLWKYPIPPWIHNEMGLSATHRQLTVGKVNAVCQKIRNILLNAEKNGMTSAGIIIKEGHFLLPILSTYAKENPPKLEEALTLIKNHASSESPKTQVGHKTKKFDEAIEYLAYLADYELIFNTAIGMYDFDLAKAVARHSQMDPKVYLPLLKHWRELPEAIARYEVDVKLKRYESALRHLVASKEVKEEAPDETNFANCLKFIEEQNLYKLGLELFRNEETMYRSIMVSLGERLLLDKKPKDALTIFLTANPSYLDGGKRASLACNNWRTFFACCAENEESVGIDQAKAIVEALSSTVGNLRDRRENCASAATILLEYAKDVSCAIDMFISAHLWSEGRRVAYLHKRLDLVKKVVDGSYTYARTCIEDFAERASTFVKANARYYEVIVIRREAIRVSEEVNDIHLDDSESVFSMQSTASITSLRSIASGTSIGSVGSVGTAASVSTVISVGAVSSFSFTGEVDAMKHKSKFNRLGRDSKKKKRPKKKGPAARRIKPGSEEELNELVATLNHACPDADYIDIICETITFLLESKKHAMAKLLFESYKELESAISRSQNARLMQDMKMRTDLGQREHEGGYKNKFTQHPCEKDIDAIVCKPLHDSIQNVLSFLL
ncbi:hypothetical protein ACHAXA_010679 [Cyclostephanos tholiformis]|uniref:Elongator complex protein 1 n=1 Tax=Cyclostephanos tholiformis TaxID=382380 RepID=A0ABD3SER5_9STRA